MPHVYLVAGEASGDELGARLIQALTAETAGALRLNGVGGPKMEAAGLSPLFPADEIALVGIAEVLPRVPRVLRRLRSVEAQVRALRPDAVVTIDAPGFNFRLGARLRGAGIPLIHYVAPTVWAWKPGRARKVARFLDRMLTLFPFEPPYFEQEGLPATFVGHPVVETPIPSLSPDFRQGWGISADAPVLLVLPGSRAGEVQRLAPRFASCVRILLQRRHDLRIVVGVAPGRKRQIESEFSGLPAILVDGDSDKRRWYAAADVALAASGSVTLELARCQTAMVVAYRMAPVTWEIVQRMATIKYANLINVMRDVEAIPEFLQRSCRPDRLARAVDSLLQNPKARARQIEITSAAIEDLRNGDLPPSQRAARAILATLDPQPDPQKGENR
ncbi:MAG: lipid-A-disaccharide synthase [Rhodospirillales bacterium]|nr:lipid-A-disaccharide synthase [Rhodospirillales bacterium]